MSEVTFQSFEAGIDAELDQDAFCAWIVAHGIEPTQTYRVDIVNGEYAVFYRYALNEQGRKFCRPAEAGPIGARTVSTAATLPPLALRIIEPLP